MVYAPILKNLSFRSLPVSSCCLPDARAGEWVGKWVAWIVCDLFSFAYRFNWRRRWSLRKTVMSLYKQFISTNESSEPRQSSHADRNRPVQSSLPCGPASMSLITKLYQIDRKRGWETLKYSPLHSSLLSWFISEWKMGLQEKQEIRRGSSRCGLTAVSPSKEGAVFYYQNNSKQFLKSTC